MNGNQHAVVVVVSYAAAGEMNVEVVMPADEAVAAAAAAVEDMEQVRTVGCCPWMSLLSECTFLAGIAMEPLAAVAATEAVVSVHIRYCSQTEEEQAEVVVGMTH